MFTCVEIANRSELTYHGWIQSAATTPTHLVSVASRGSHNLSFFPFPHVQHVVVILTNTDQQLQNTVNNTDMWCEGHHSLQCDIVVYTAQHLMNCLQIKCLVVYFSISTEVDHRDSSVVSFLQDRNRFCCYAVPHANVGLFPDLSRGYEGFVGMNSKTRGGD